MDSILLEKLIDLKIDPAKTIFWVGSGASHDDPCGLPVGNTLADYYLETALGKCKAQRIKHLWQSAIIDIPDYPKSKDYNMRLEFIIGAINQLDMEFSNITFIKKTNQRKYKRFPLINGFLSFSDHSYNYNHYGLAKLIHAGGVLVTTNYDLCIENALKSPYDISQNTDDDVDTVRCFPNIECYHIHGIAKGRDLMKSMGATIKRVKRKLPSKFTSEIKKYFEQGYNIIFIGYSGSDFFDVTPFFESLPKNIYSGTALFFSHGIPDLSTKINTLTSSFQSKCQVYGDTRWFLYHLCSKNGLNILTPEEWTKKYGGPSKDWKDGFNRILAQYKSGNALETFHFINALKLTNQSGIHIQRLYPDWEKKICEIVTDWKVDSKQTLKHMVATPHDFNQSLLSDIQFHTKRNTSWQTQMVYSIIQHSVRRYRKNRYVPPNRNTRLSYEELHQRVAETCYTILNDCYDTKLRDRESFTIQYLYGKCQHWVNLWKIPWNRALAINELKRLKAEVDRLSILPYSQFLYISYYLDIWRIKNLLDSILEEGPSLDHHNVEFEIALEITSIGTIGRVYDNLANQYLIEAIKKQSVPMLIKSRQYHTRGESAHNFMKPDSL